jgi:hypothetical protein
MDDKTLLGCCGSYCKTCKVFKDALCKGCKIGYSDNSRDLSKVKCKMKKCCISNGYISCADCKKFETCEIINTFYNKNGYKYKKYNEALSFIRNNGYAEFFSIANKWKMQYGKYPK